MRYPLINYAFGGRNGKEFGALSLVDHTLNKSLTKDGLATRVYKIPGYFCGYRETRSARTDVGLSKGDEVMAIMNTHSRTVQVHLRKAVFIPRLGKIDLDRYSFRLPHGVENGGQGKFSRKEFRQGGLGEG